MSPATQAGYDELVSILEAELAPVAAGFEQLTADQWRTPTNLIPIEPNKPRWTLLELAGHLDISIGITRMLIADAVSGEPVSERDAVDLFIFPSAEVPSEFYDYAYTMVEDREPSALAGGLRDTFTQTVDEARRTEPSTVGAFSGFEPYPLIRLDDFISTRIVEAVVHGIDLTDALGCPSTATREGVAHTAGILDSLLTRSRVGGRPLDLDDDVAWLRAASGRATHPDPRLPLIL
jgi:uncharacterized protein (TIGR03083 family)